MSNLQETKDGDNENKVVAVEDLELGEMGSDTMEEHESNEFSIVGPLPNESSGKQIRRLSNASNITANSNKSNHVQIAVSFLKKRPSLSRQGSKTSVSITSKSVYTGKTMSTGRTGSTSGSGHYSPTAAGAPRHIFYGRWLFFMLLCMVASTLGYLTYYILTNNETFLAECVFTKTATHAIKAISENQKKKKLGMDSMGSVVGSTGSSRDQWPFVSQMDYESIAMNIIDTSNGCFIAYAPILTPVQVPAFESFAEDFYQNSRQPETWPNGTGVKVEDRVAVWAMDGETPFHDGYGATSWSSTRRIIVPILQHAAGPSKMLMFNLHSSPLIGKIIDDMITCAEETKGLIREHERRYSKDMILEDGKEIPPLPSLKDCTMVTDISHNKTSFVQQEPMGPGANMMQPIFPANNKTEMVGVLMTQIVWTANMKDVFSKNVHGIDIVLSTPTQEVSYRVINGVPTYLGIGDFHDPKYDAFKMEGDVTLPGYFARQSVPYTIALYPSEDLYKMYATKNPYYSTIGGICIMIFTVLMFMAYDFLVRREFSAKHELLKAKRHFMRYVSHEVRTPLNSVCMGLNLMQEEIQAKLTSPGNNGSKDAMITIEEAEAWLSLSRDVHISAQSATNVLNDFLNYDKIESRQLTLDLSTVPIQPLIRQTVSEFILPAQDKLIALSTIQEKVNANDMSCSKAGVEHINEIASELLEDQVVIGDKARLAQVIRNIISNAIKFTPNEGSITIKSTWIVASVGESSNVNLQDGQTEDLDQSGWIQIEVTDTGPGMTEEQLATVFESGVQFNANKNQKGGGSGLGLFIAKGIVDQHNGTLIVTSDGLGKGSSFVCKLPVFCKPKLQKMDNVSLSVRDESISERVCSTWLDDHNDAEHCYRILVVDDAPMNRKLLTRLLIKRGHHVDMAEDGLQAYEMVVAQMKEGKRYDTILMDYQMPVMDGPTATHRIRAEGCDSFIVGITGNVLPQDIDHFKMCGADGVLGKPFQVEELESMWIEYGVTSESELFYR